jgi:hypothetical protein
MEPLRLGGVRPGAADLFVTISDDAGPFLRVDIYRSPEQEAFVFQDVIIWNERVFVGFGERVYVIDPVKRIGSHIILSGFAGYFGGFYTASEYLLVASGDSLRRLAPDGRVLWAAPHLGLDGVIVDSVENGIIRGQGEWDPPGGWKPFAMQLDSGQIIADR